MNAAAFARRRAAVPTALAALALLPATVPARAAQLDFSATTPFTQQVAQQFSVWDADRDGVLSPAEVDARVADPLVAGDPAAALGAIKRALRSAARSRHPLPPLTRDYFDAYGRHVTARRRGGAPAPSLADPDGDTATTPAGAAGAGAPAPSAAYPDFDRAYHTGMVLIRGAGRDVFGPNDPAFESIDQGPSGDCYLLAALGGMVARDPASVRKMVSVLPDGSCEVRFASSPKSHLVPALTDGQIALYGTSAGRARWLLVLEEAYGMARNGALPEAMRAAVASDLVVQGGSPRYTLSFLTGRATGGMGFRRGVGPDAPAPTAEEVAPLLPQLRENIAAAARERRLIVAGVGAGPRPPGIVGRHAYAFLGYDPARDAVRVWNPHRDDFDPRGPAGVENGYPTRAGVFEVPLADLPRVFLSVSWELSEPLPAKPPTPPVRGGVPPGRPRG